MTIGLAIMRLQPLHKGHQRIINLMLAQNECSYIMIGSSDTIDERNPWTFDERRLMIEKIYASQIANGQLVVIGINDIHNPPKWVEHVLTHLPQKPDIYYCGKGQDAPLFIEKGFQVQEINRDDFSLSATQIRQKLSINDESWKKDVPTQLHSIIRKKQKGNTMQRNQFSALFCDLYHLTMAQAMFDAGTHNRIETYEMYIRKTPFNGSYLVTAGLSEVLKWMNDWNFTAKDIEFLRQQGFKEEFLKEIQNSKLQISIDAMPEGEIAFSNEPILRVTGPAWQAMIVEAAILNIVNSQSLIATKASRICRAATCDGHKRRVLELGLRRAQDMQGFTPTRASYIGGVDATSNVEAGRYYNIPIAGTMAHCFIMREESETEAFKNYIRSFPDKASVLIDTYDTIQGAKNAIEAAKAVGVPLKSVRLDSGDLAYLAKQVRQILNEAGFKETQITASNDLDEKTIQSLVLEQKAPIDVFGVGTMLVTSYDQPALGGVYKLKQTGGRDVIKVSELSIKTTIPGATDVVRILNKDGKYAGDIIYKKGIDMLKNSQLIADVSSVNLSLETTKVFPKGMSGYYPLVPVMRRGVVNKNHMNRPIAEIREAVLQNLAKMDDSHLRLQNPHAYIAGVEEKLFITRQNMRTTALKQKERTYEN